MEINSLINLVGSLENPVRRRKKSGRLIVINKDNYCPDYSV